MPINMTDYKMIVHERVYNVLQIILDFDRDPQRTGPRHSRNSLTQYTLTKTE